METGLGQVRLDMDYDSDSVGWKLQLMTNDQEEGDDGESSGMSSNRNWSLFYYRLNGGTLERERREGRE